MTNEAQLSSVMLCFNRLRLSQQCLVSYLNTISVPYEIIIVNNASTDGTTDWLEEVKTQTHIKQIIHRKTNDAAAGLNEGLASCTGSYLHVMENDYVYLDGWDKYVLECFNEITELGQLCICFGARRMLGEHHRKRLYLAKGNVVSSSVFRRTIFFDHNIRWRNSYRDVTPDDTEFSSAVRRAGFLVAWPDRLITHSVGFSREEFKRDPDYYIRNYKQKVYAAARSGSMAKDILQLHLNPIHKEFMERLAMLYWTKLVRRFRARD